jgi:hypothetical protein
MICDKYRGKNAGPQSVKRLLGIGFIILFLSALGLDLFGRFEMWWNYNGSE